MDRRSTTPASAAKPNETPHSSATDQSIGRTMHQKKVTKADLDRAVEAIKLLGLMPTAVEVTPGKVRFVVGAEDEVTADTEDELTAFRKRHGYG